MSALDVLGAVASAVQLAETCLKMVDLFNRIRDAPAIVRKRIVAVEKFVEIASLIEHSPALQTPLIAGILTQALVDANQLFEILTKIDA